MKYILILTLTLITLNASIFDSYADNSTSKSGINKFRKTVSDANAIVKKGEHSRYDAYQKTTSSIVKDIETYDLSQQEKRILRKNISTYAQLINSVYTNIQHKTPNIDKHYTEVLHGLLNCNAKISSTGYTPLINEWYDLTKIKYFFTKKPSIELARKFDKKYKAVILVLEDLCLDEELEEPLLAYLNAYNTYFQELRTVYSSVTYAKIQTIKPLSYEIKSNLQFAMGL